MEIFLTFSSCTKENLRRFTLNIFEHLQSGNIPGIAKPARFLGDYLVLSRILKGHLFTGVSLRAPRKAGVKSQWIVSTNFAYNTTWSK